MRDLVPTIDRISLLYICNPSFEITLFYHDTELFYQVENITVVLALMSSCNPHKSYLGSVHDSHSESSIEYVLTQSSMSPKIQLKTPIASSMNLSGLNIDVGNATSQTSSTW
ncbi:hypothetical protein O181_004343 [Austropuccinia psidii MF-1]|uniref:Uncharacterized protein n=1 Tax=Austropuccinia psidii MF-1 TaxID=1389203 RepID=A0A9Q3BG59_9BASI|nr:hypothetical protein [Austropuccinia psidii MF-1]